MAAVRGISCWPDSMGQPPAGKGVPCHREHGWSCTDVTRAQPSCGIGRLCCHLEHQVHQQRLLAGLLQQTRLAVTSGATSQSSSCAGCTLDAAPGLGGGGHSDLAPARLAPGPCTAAQSHTWMQPSRRATSAAWEASCSASSVARRVLSASSLCSLRRMSTTCPALWPCACTCTCQSGTVLSASSRRLRRQACSCLPVMAISSCGTCDAQGPAGLSTQAGSSPARPNKAQEAHSVMLCVRVGTQPGGAQAASPPAWPPAWPAAR